jgi:hypothetical protein
VVCNNGCCVSCKHGDQAFARDSLLLDTSQLLIGCCQRLVRCAFLQTRKSALVSNETYRYKAGRRTAALSFWHCGTHISL